MFWLVVCPIVGLIAVVAFVAWRKWIALWRQIEEVVTQIERGERPRTFLLEDGGRAKRVGFQLEKIFNELEQLNKQVAKRESGLQTIFSAMQDALMMVDSNGPVILTNVPFRKLFA